MAYTPTSSASNNQGWWNNWGWSGNSNSICTSNESDTQYWQWNGEQNLTLNGDARYQNNALELTNNLHQTSNAFWSNPFSLYTQHGSARSFSAAFSFTIDNPKGAFDHDGQGGDGLAFIINNSNQELGEGGAGLGYAGLQNSVVVEFDTFKNGWQDRHSGNQIGINLGGNTRSKHARRLQQRLNDQQKRYVWIDYKARYKKLEVRISTNDERPRYPVMSKRVSINWWLNSSEAYIGFSAATGEAGNTHTIHNFEFVTAYAPIGECEPPEFISEPVVDAVADIQYTYQAQASDATSGDTLTYSLINVPTGMTINSDTGLIDWLPTNEQVGEHPVEIQVTDSIGLSDQQSFLITVVENNQCNIEGNATVHYEQFDDLSAWQLNGTAASLTPNNSNVLRLTKQLSQSGSAFLKAPVALTDDNGFKASFSAAFSFKMSHPIGISDQDGKGADGLVFVVQTMDSNVGGAGGSIGYGEIQNSLGIEFDTWNNGSVDNNNGNHIGINIDGSVDSIKIKPIHKRLNNGQTWYAWVDYDGMNQNLEIRLSKYPNRPVEPTLTKDNINLPVILQNENAYIGFTSGTGAAGGKHDIKSFTFTNTLAPIGDCGELAITSTPPTEIITGQTLSYQLEASGAETGATLTYSITNGPSSATINENGLLTWQAAGIGNVDFTVQVEDDNNNTAEQSFTINVLPIPNQAPVANNINANTNEDNNTNITLDASDANGDNLTYSIIQQPQNGILTGTAPNLIYTPNPNTSGTDSFTYQANDGQVNSNVAAVNITIIPQNDAPVANNQSISTNEDTVATATVTATDIDSTNLTYQLQQQASNGIVTLQTNGQFSYTPNANVSGNDSFTFIANDGNVNSNTATVSITINAINDAPVANNQSVSTDEDSASNITLTATDIDNATLTYTITQQPTNGSLTGTTPNLTYTPNANFNGTDSFEFVTNDGTDNSNIATVDITVNAVNDEPTINITSPTGILIFTDADTINFAANASDIEDGDISNQIEWTASPATTLGTGAQINTTLAAGDYVVAVQITDSDGASVSDTINIQVLISNIAPVAQDLTAQVESGQNVTIDLVAVDIDADPLTYAITTQPQNGSATLQDSQITYTANAGFTGQDRIEYVANDGTVNSNVAEIIITVTQANEAPQITSQPNLQATEGSLYEYQVTATDSNATDTLTYSLNNAPASATIDPQTGLIQWTPTAEQAGYNTDNNPYCLSSSESNPDQRFADIVFVADRSGSMGGETEFIQTLAPLLDANLIQNNIGAGIETNLFGLVMFGGAEIPFEMDGQGSLFATSAQFYNATQPFRPDGGGTEDGWDAIVNQALRYPVRETAAKNIILVTDEDRDNSNNDLTVELVQIAIQDADVILNAIVNASFECADGRIALGKGQNDIGYVADGLRGFTTCEGVTVTGLTSDSNRFTDIHYIDLALSLGGAAWDLNILRSGGTDAQSFVRALLDIKVEEIDKQLTTQPQADIVIENLNYNSGQISLVIKNRGLVDITAPFTIDLLDGASVITTLTVNSLAIGESQTLTHTYELTGSLGITINAPGINECSIENNQLIPTQFDISVNDDSGLSQTQQFALTVTNINQTPQIISTAPTIAPINSEYRYQVEVNDPDKAEGLNYTLTQSPDGMRIDSVSGLITFKPAIDQAGQYTVEVNVADINGLVDTQTYIVTVDNSYIIPRFTSEPEVRAIQSEQYNYSPTVQSDATAQLTYSLLLSPNSMTVNAQTGEVSWSIPDTAPGEQYPLVLKVEDQFNNVDVQAYELIGDTPPIPPQVVGGLGTYDLGQEVGTSFEYRDFNYAYEIDHQFNIASGPAGTSIATETTDKAFFGQTCGPNPANGREICGLWQFTRGNFSWVADANYPGAPKINTTTTGQNTYCRSPDSVGSDFEATQKFAISNLRGRTIAGPLYDSNRDGVLNKEDKNYLIGYSIVNRFNLYLVAVDPDSGKVVWQSQESINGNSRGTLIDLEGDASAELIFFDRDNKLIVFNSDGSLRWRSQEAAATGLVRTHAVPVDLDNDGTYEIAFGPSVYDANGNLLWRFPLSSSEAALGDTLAIDFDQDGTKEIAHFNQVRDTQGNLLWDIPINNTVAVSGSVYLAYANFDDDENPELLVNEEYYDAQLRRVKRWLMLIDHDGSKIWETEVDITSAGHMSIMDIDGDGDLEIYSPSNSGLYDHTGQVIWKNQQSYRNGVVADINNDGYLEALEGSSAGVAIIDLTTGRQVHNIALRSSPTNVAEIMYADIDNDNQGEIVITGSSPLSVFESTANNWSAASPVYAYYQQSDGEVNDQLRFDNKAGNFFAQIAPTGIPGAAPVIEQISDVVVNAVFAQHSAGAISSPSSSWRVFARVANQGTTTADNVIVEFFTDDPAQATNKFAEINFGSIEAGIATEQTIVIDNDDVLGNEIFAVIKTSSEECNTNNNIASAYTVRVRVTDSDGLSDTVGNSIGATDNRNVQILSEPPTEAIVGQTYQYQINAQAYNQDYLNYALEGRAPGVSINPLTGLVTWVPTIDQAGRSYPLTVVVQDNIVTSRVSAFQNFTVRVASEANAAPQITSTEITEGRVGQLYNYQVIASDADGENIAYSLVNPPTGMSINGLSGLISWIPDAVGDYNITVRARDERNAVNDQTYTLAIADNQPPIAYEQNIATNENQSIDLTLIGADEDGDPLSYTIIDYPQNGTLTGIAPNYTYIPASNFKGEDSLIFSVNDGEVNSNLAAISIVVREQNLAPSIVSGANTQGVENQAYTYSVMATDPNNDPLDYNLLSGETDFTITRSTGVIETTAQLHLESIREDNIYCEAAANPISEISPVIKWQWSATDSPQPLSDQVLQTPIVIPLLDTNNDNVIDSKDDKAIIFATYVNPEFRRNGTLRAISAKTGEHLWTSNIDSILPLATLAAADINNDGLPEIIAPIADGNIIAIDNQGEELWRSTSLNIFNSAVLWGGAAIADLDADGITEIIVGNAILDNNGNLKYQGVGPSSRSVVGVGPLSFAADINLDGFQEVIAGGAVYNHEGDLLVNNGEGFSAVGNFDNDDFAEIVVVYNGRVSLYNHDGSVIWQNSTIRGGGVGGAPTIADMTGNGVPEIGVAGASFYVVFDAQGNELWSSPVNDVSSSATGSSVFDFNGDGISEVVYADQDNLRIYDGPTGNILAEIPNRSGTTLEYPVIADIDNDNHAEIVIISNNNPDGFVGVRAFEDSNDNWAATRSILNQHAYAISNINDDLTVPANPDKSWLTHNTFRLNTFLDSDITPLSLPDLTLFNLHYDDDQQLLSVELRNRGLLPATGDVLIEFFNGTSDTGSKLGEVTIADINASSSQNIILASIEENLLGAIVSAKITYTDSTSGVNNECLLNNNTISAQVVTVEVSDPSGLSDQQTYLYSTINVNDVPTIVSGIDNQTLRSNAAYTNIVSVLDPDTGDAHRFSLSLAPDGLTINAITGEISALANAFTEGVYNYTVQVQDLADNTSEQQYTFTVVNQNANNVPPVISSEAPTNVVFGDTYNYSLVATDADNDFLTYLLNTSPAGMSINSTTGEITWQPLQNQVGDNNMVIAVDDGRGGVTEQSYVLTVSPNLAPVFTTAPLLSVALGQAYNYNAIAIDPEGQVIQYSLVAGPQDLSINPQGQINFIPTADQLGLQNIIIQATDNVGNIAEQAYTLEVVAPVNQNPVINSLPINSGLSGQPYNYQVIAADADNDSLTYSVINQPVGMSIDSISGLISWPSTTEGNYGITVRVADGLGGLAEQVYILSITTTTEENQPPSIISTPIFTATTDNTYTYNVIASDSDNDALSYSLTQLPTGMTIDAQTGAISWTPTLLQLGSNAVVIAVSDGRGAVTTQSYSVTVTEASTVLPELINQPLLDAFADVNYEYNLYAAAEGVTVANVILIDGPPGMTLTFNSGTNAYDINWIPPEGDCQHDVTVELVARNGLTQEVTFTITVHNAPRRLNRFQCSLDSASCPAN